VLCHVAESHRRKKPIGESKPKKPHACSKRWKGWKLPLVKLVQLSEGLQRRLLRAAIMRAKAIYAALISATWSRSAVWPLMEGTWAVVPGK